LLVFYENRVIHNAHLPLLHKTPQNRKKLKFLGKTTPKKAVFP